MARQFIRAARLDEVLPGSVLLVDVDLEHLVLCNVDGRIYAVEDVCTHDGGPLGEGILEGCALECPRHGAQFDVRTGEVLRPPAYLPIRTFPVKVEDGQILVEVELD